MYIYIYMYLIIYIWGSGAFADDGVAAPEHAARRGVLGVREARRPRVYDLNRIYEKPIKYTRV